MTELESIAETLASTLANGELPAEPWIERGGVFWLDLPDLNVREVAARDEYRGRALYHHHRLSEARR